MGFLFSFSFNQQAEASAFHRKLRLHTDFSIRERIKGKMHKIYNFHSYVPDSLRKHRQHKYQILIENKEMFNDNMPFPCPMKSFNPVSAFTATKANIFSCNHVICLTLLLLMPVKASKALMPSLVVRHQSRAQQILRCFLSAT